MKTIEGGSAISVTLMLDGQPVKFNFVLVKDLNFNFMDSPPESAWISEDNNLMWIGGFYSGGATGGGRYPNDIKLAADLLPRYQIIARTAAEADELLAERAEKQQDERTAWIKSQEEKVARINALPTRFELLTYAQTEFYVTRGEAQFDPKRSNQVRYSLEIRHRNAERPDEDGHRNHLELDDYFSTDGRLLTKKFAIDSLWKFGPLASSQMMKELKTMMTMLKAKFSEVKKLVEEETK